MNRIFKTIWSDTLQTWIAVSELAKGKSKNTASRPTPLVAATIITTIVLAIPNSVWSAEWVAGTGNYDTGSNWDTGSVPDGADVTINNGGEAILAGFLPAPAINITLGLDNSGTLTIQGGSSFDVSLRTYLGSESTGSGVLNVDGTDTSFTSFDLLVGYAGEGELNITNGGSVSNNNAFIAYDTGSTGLVNVDGVDSSWTINNGLSVEMGGDGELNISNGGSVSSRYFVDIGGYAGSTGLVTVDGVGSILDTSTLRLGITGDGEISITNSGEVETYRAELGGSAGSTGLVTVDGTDSSWTNANYLAVGNNGDGEISITNGGEVETNNATLGANAGSTGLVTVDGTGSSWSNADDLTVGENGDGELNITNGGSVTTGNYLSLGRLADSTGIVNIDGTDSILSVSGRSHIGGFGSGELNITNGGTFASAGFLYVGGISSGLVTVDGAGSLLRADGILINQSGDGELRVTDGGRVITNVLVIEDGNHVLVDGFGSSLESTGNIDIGHLNDNSSLSVSNGASVSAASFTLWNASSASTANTINIGAARGETAIGAGTLTGSITINSGVSGLVLNHTETDYQLSSDILGYGRVDLLAGTTRFTGDLSSYTGNLTTDGGTLQIDSSDTLSLGGNYTQTSAGLLSLGVADDSTFGRLNVAGTATFASNAAIFVDVTDPNYAFSTDLLEDVVTAGTLVSDGSFDVADNSLLFDFDAVLDGNAIDLTLALSPTDPDPTDPDPTDPDPTDPSGSSDLVLSLMTNPATFGAAASIDDLLAIDPSSAFASEFVPLSTQQQVAGAVESVLPAMSGAIAQATTDIVDSFGRVVDSRQAAITNNLITDKHVWFTPFGSWADQDQRHRVSGYDIDNHGMALGADTALTDSLNVGMALSYIDSKIESRAGSGSQDVKVDSYLASLYATKSLDNNTTLKFKAGMGLSDYDSRRVIFNGDVAQADYDSWHTHLGAELARQFNLSDSTSVSPYLFTDYTYVKVDDYRESGSGLFSLDVENDSADSLLMGLGLRTDHVLANNWSVGLDASVGYDAMADRSDLTAAFAGGGAQFTTRGIKPAKWQYDAGVSARYRLGSATDVSAGYNITTRNGYQDEYANVTMRVVF